MRGSIKERPEGSGRWQLRVYAGRNANGSAVFKTSTFRGGRRAAERELARLITEVSGGRLEAAGIGVTVNTLLDRWLEHIARDGTPRTLQGYRGYVEGRLKPVFGSTRLDKLRADQIDRAMAAWLDEGLQPATVRQLYAILSAALQQAFRWGWVSENPARRARPPTVKRAPMTVPAPTELLALIREAEEGNDNGVLAAAITLAAATGCRRGELCALRWSDVASDEERTVLTVARSLAWVDGIKEGDTKTHQSRRLALDGFGAQVIRTRMDRQRAWAERVGVVLDADPYLLSRSARGNLPCLPDGLSHGFSRVAKRLGMGWHFHHLRHWAATTAIAAGHDVRTVAGRLGHADASTTLRVYSHVVEARDLEVAGSLSRALQAATD